MPLPLPALFLLGRQLCCPDARERPTRAAVGLLVVIWVYATVLVLAGVDPSMVTLLVSLSCVVATSAVAYRARAPRRPI